MADPRIEWYPDDAVPRQGVARVVNVPQAYVLAFGDGSTVAKDADDIYSHSYAVAGPYAMTVTLVGQTEPVATRLINVLDATVPNVTIASPVGTQMIRVSFHGPELPVVGRYTIDWTPTDSQEVLAEPGSFVERVFTPGVHTIRVTDQWSQLSLIQEVTVVAIVEDPEVTIGPDASDATGMSVVLDVVGVASAGPEDTLTIGWGDRTSEVVPAVVGTSVAHTYAYGDSYMVEVAYTDNAALSTTMFVSVPLAA